MKAFINATIHSLIGLVLFVTMITDVSATPVSTIDQSGLITWTLDGVTSFQFGETANGSFIIDQSIANLPLGPAPLAGWNIEVTGGFNPNIPNITFSDVDTGCVVACARIFKGTDIIPITPIDFRTPLAADNTFYELVLTIDAITDDVIFPRTAELAVIGNALMFQSNIQYNQLIDMNTVRGIDRSDLTSNGRIITTQPIDEPSTLRLVIIALTVASFTFRLRSWSRFAEG